MDKHTGHMTDSCSSPAGTVQTPGPAGGAGAAAGTTEIGGGDIPPGAPGVRHVSGVFVHSPSTSCSLLSKWTRDLYQVQGESGGLSDMSGDHDQLCQSGGRHHHPEDPAPV